MGKTKKNTAKIAIILIIVTLVDVTMPILHSQANFFAVVEAIIDEGIKQVFNAIAQLLLDLGDLIIQTLQSIFTNNNNIRTTHIYIRYSPGIIFSGQVPGLDANFISPGSSRNYLGDNNVEDILYNMFISSDEDELINKSGLSSSLDGTAYDYGFSENERILIFETGYKSTGSHLVSFTCWEYDNKYYIWEHDVYHTSIGQHSENDFIYRVTADIDAQLAQNEQDQAQTKESSAGMLKESIATWYKTMREIALVGLLCVLVYAAIRMILSSSAEDKAKYKKMLTDWVTAVCIIFLMHFMMSLTFTGCKKITEVFNTSIIGKYGEDVLMSGIRTDIAGVGEEHYDRAFANIIIYLVLVILTIVYTYQYLKRFIYIAFLTMIAPLVALTYPLDKMKDGSAQAFTTWLREFIFSVLLQPVHLIVYWILLGFSKDLADPNSAIYNPIYAIVAISFIVPAEKFIRKMFGFDKSEAVSQMGAAFGGAAIMTGINKLGGMFKPKQGAKAGQGGNNSGSGSKIRTANQPETPYTALKDEGEKEIKQEKEKKEKKEKNENKVRYTRKLKGKKSKKRIQHKKNKNQKIHERAKIASENVKKQKEAKEKARQKEAKKKKIEEKRKARKAKTSKKRYKQAGGGKLKRYAPKVIRGFVRGTSKMAGAATLGTIGLAAGLATGDLSKAAAGLTGGVIAGNKLGKGIADWEINTVNSIQNKLGRANNEETINEFINAGIEDADKIEIAIKNGYSAGEATAYMKMAKAKDLPESVLKDEEKFKTYLRARDIPTDNADAIRKGILAFK